MTEAINNDQAVAQAVELAGGDLPQLTGSKKQLGWAYGIREYYMTHSAVDAKTLAEQTDAKWWIESRLDICGEGVDEFTAFRKLIGSLPELSGTDKQVKWAKSVRIDLAKKYPSAKALRTIKDATVWIDLAELVANGTFEANGSESNDSES